MFALQVDFGRPECPRRRLSPGPHGPGGGGRGTRGPMDPAAHGPGAPWARRGDLPGQKDAGYTRLSRIKLDFLGPAGLAKTIGYFDPASTAVARRNG